MFDLERIINITIERDESALVEHIKRSTELWERRARLFENPISSQNLKEIAQVYEDIVHETIARNPYFRTLVLLSGRFQIPLPKTYR
ncbi:MAG: hypothetical protein Q7R43_02140 [Candidatus Daviesbacteria bacterium]|nr:hypothetical protein [Candidatus Daviesbacteria bacterium]